MTLRPYQQRAVDAAIGHMRKSIEPILIDAATGAGKSHIIAEIARIIHGHTGKRVLCLAPSAELVQQNREKYLAAGFPASMYSASAGAKELRHPVIFGSPLTVKNRISAFQREGKEGFALVIIDEAHGMSVPNPKAKKKGKPPTLYAIIEAMRQANPNLRVLGMTATPYRLGSGYIFRIWPDGDVNTDQECANPYFVKCVDSIGARELIEQGYLTPPVIGATNAEGYDTSGLALNSRGQFDAADVDRAYHGHGRKTAAIVGDIVAQARDRQGVIIYAATVQHAHEVLASLPPGLSAIVTGDTPKPERADMLRKFKSRQLKYLVNVAVLTTGFDAPHVDVIAILRKTESVGLLQQIIGRGLRLADGKTDCLVLDYTSNLEDHCPDGDLFTPRVQAKPQGEGAEIVVNCPLCATEQKFSVRADYADADHDDAGYVLDLDGNRLEGDYGPIPKHFGRRCNGMIQSGPMGTYERCSYRWTGKDCPECGEPNDIAARYCFACRTELVDPNEKLIANFKALKRDPTQLQTDEVVSMTCVPGISQRGNRTLRVEWRTPYRQFATWLQPEATHTKGMREWAEFQAATNGGDDPPLTITYRKDAQSGFYRIFRYNQPADVDPAEQRELTHAAE